VPKVDPASQDKWEDQYMKRTVLGGLTLALSLLIAAPSVAMAASPAPTQHQTTAAPQVGPLTVPIVGTAGTDAVATITSFQVVDGVLTAVGTITGTVATTDVAGTTILTDVTDAAFSAPVSILQAPGASCEILDLVLGPLHLDLLGLVVDLSQVDLDITAVPGPGNLLGNLLCAVVRLLDGGNTTALQNILDVLNRILGG
jgi:hypothetical protein